MLVTIFFQSWNCNFNDNINYDNPSDDVAVDDDDQHINDDFSDNFNNVDDNDVDNGDDFNHDDNNDVYYYSGTGRLKRSVLSVSISGLMIYHQLCLTYRR